jgi:uncharacterized Zn finger protein
VKGKNRYDERYTWPVDRPIPTEEGIKTRSQQGKIGESWWAARWTQALEQLVDAGRLRRGRSYARSGQVLSIEERPGEVRAKVLGSNEIPYRVTIRLAPLSDEQWELVIDQMAGQASFTAQLLAGSMPTSIEDAFLAAGVSLFPEQGLDLTTDCTCPDWANPCKHVAAAHYILGEQFDEDPFMIFRLRGRTQEQILAGLRARRAAGAETECDVEPEEAAPAPAEAPLEESVESFWSEPEKLDGFHLAITTPTVPLPMLKRLGPPAFLPGQDLSEVLESAYRIISDSAMAAAYDADGEPDEEGDPGREGE